MERVPGHSVRRLLNERQWLSASLAISVARQTASALAALHAAGYVHGDVKPDNLHLNPDRKCTLLDLGFAHRADSESFVNGYVLGTANYVAPELCEQPECDTSSADIFSLGVTLFEVLTGVLPYPSGNVEQTMLRHRDHRPESLSGWEGAWSSGLSELVDWMLSRDASRRPTAVSIVRELSDLERRVGRSSTAA
jgi:serine/threonine protein kinase